MTTYNHLPDTAMKQPNLKRRQANESSVANMLIAQPGSIHLATSKTTSYCYQLDARQHHKSIRSPSPPQSCSLVSTSSTFNSSSRITSQHHHRKRVRLSLCLLSCFIIGLLVQTTCSDALWMPSMFQNPFNGSFVRRLASSARQASGVDVSPVAPVHLPQQDQAQQAIQEVAIDGTAPLDQQQQQQSLVTGGALAPGGGGGYGLGYGSILEMAGIRPQSIASLLNTVGDTGFRYFNIQDQCRNRAACDLGFMLYKKLSFVHNWLIRTSVRSLTDMNNPYTQSWMEGMLGRNCTTVYPTCRQSPLEGLMNLAILQQLSGQGHH